MRKNKKQHKF